MSSANRSEREGLFDRSTRCKSQARNDTRRLHTLFRRPSSKRERTVIGNKREREKGVEEKRGGGRAFLRELGRVSAMRTRLYKSKNTKAALSCVAVSTSFDLLYLYERIYRVWHHACARSLREEHSALRVPCVAQRQPSSTRPPQNVLVVHSPSSSPPRRRGRLSLV